MTATTEASEVDFQQRLGRSYKKTSIILGVIGLFILGIPLGIAAFIYARKAGAQGVKSAGAVVLAILDIVLAIFILVVFKPLNI